MKNTLKTIVLFIIPAILLFTQCEEDIPTPKPIFNISLKQINFGDVASKELVTREISISNKGGGELNIAKSEFVGSHKTEFTTNIELPLKLEANQSYIFNISFKPLTEGKKEAALLITVDGVQHRVLLEGMATVSEDDEIHDAWLFFKDKPKVANYLYNPVSMLSNKALERRQKEDVKLDTVDVPIDKSYLQKLYSIKDIQILAKSKWLNAVHIKGKLANIKKVKKQFKFISRVEYADRTIESKNKSVVYNTSREKTKFEALETNYQYGKAKQQVEMLNVNFLHKNDFTGKGITIAVIDAGFPNVDKLSGFQRIRDNNQILGGYDFVERSNYFYSGNSHGTHVLSTIAAYIQNGVDNFVGTAPDASFYLFRTEDAVNEIPLEESLWVEAAEMADSLGVDIITTSLGYTTFDNPNYDHTYNDLDGQTTFISRGAEIAASRGIVVLNAAGNEGNKSWRYISAPADAKSVLTVGAVGANGEIATFSSWGPTADGRTKPDIMAMGQKAIVVNYQTDKTAETNGTSFSTPIMCGAVACLLQSRPNKKVSEIIEEIKKGSNNYSKPNNSYGYGIPNFEQIYLQLE